MALRRLDGGLLPVESRGKSIPYKGRMVQVTTCIDVSERRRSEEEQRILEAEIRQNQKLDSLGTLAGGIAHDFNNILMAINGYVHLIQGDAPAIAPGRRSKRLVRRVFYNCSLQS